MSEEKLKVVSTPVDLDSLTDEAIEQMANVLFSADERKLH
jgi:hypothetical protein